MKHILGELQPRKVWAYFEEICQIPRPSGREEKIMEYLIGFANTHTLAYKQDDAGNLLIMKEACKGFEEREVVVLQSHVDMVCEKNADVAHDFSADPILPFIDGDWVRAKGTTLGADDGIGMALQLAILESDTIEHGALECLFTVEEETGLGGAFGLKQGFVTGRILLNLDSEDDGELFIGCAGGLDTTIRMPFRKEDIEQGRKALKIVVSGLQGGHSGDDINKGRGNAVKILNRLLWNGWKTAAFSLAKIEGGNLRNAIAREAFAIITLPAKEEKAFLERMSTLSDLITREMGSREPQLAISVNGVELPSWSMDAESQEKLLNALYGCPHGVMAMSHDIEGLVESSTNLASVRTLDNEVLIATSQRSSIDTGIRDVAAMVRSVFSLAGASVDHGDGYPGWKPNLQSPILATMTKVYRQLFKEDPKVLAIHAGLECGVIGETYPGMDMISYGPTIRGAHSPDERIQIDTVEKFWQLTLETLRQIPKKQ